MQRTKIMAAVFTTAFAMTAAVATVMPAWAAAGTFEKLDTMTIDYSNQITTINYTYYDNGDVKSLSSVSESGGNFIYSEKIELGTDGNCTLIELKQPSDSSESDNTYVYDNQGRLLKETAITTTGTTITNVESVYTYSGTVMYPVRGTSATVVTTEDGTVISKQNFAYSEYVYSEDTGMVSYMVKTGDMTELDSTDISQFTYYLDVEEISYLVGMSDPKQYYEDLAKSADQNYVVRDSKTNQLKSLIAAQTGQYMKASDFVYDSYGEPVTGTISFMNDYTSKPDKTGKVTFEYIEFSSDNDSTEDVALPVVGTKAVSKGDTIRNSTAAFTVTTPASAKKAGTVTYKKPAKKTKTVTVPATVTINGSKYTVTAIAANAFKNNSKLTTVTIGKNVKKIGANAFYNCKNLKKCVIKTTKLTGKTVGKNAFAKINKKAKIKVPAKKLKSYKKILKKAGVKKSTQKITK